MKITFMEILVILILILTVLSIIGIILDIRESEEEDMATKIETILRNHIEVIPNDCRTLYN